MSHPTRRLLAALGPDPAVPADADLLNRFARTRDAGAFELLVHRHAPLVLRACRGVLRDRHAAEDAAQATFLALARQAGSVRGDTLPGWLFRVARRVAARAARRHLPTVDAEPDAIPTAPTPMPTPDPAEVHALHDELARLPEAYRSPLLLAYFEGLTYPEVARRLGWPLGTVTGRVARAKTALAVRLARRGFAPAVLAVAAEEVSAGFAAVTTGAAVAYTAGVGTGASAAVTELAGREVRRAATTKLVRLAGAVVVCGAVTLSLGASSGGDPPAAPPAPPQQAPPAPPRVPAAANPKAVVGKGFFVAPVTTDLQRRMLRGSEASRAVVWVDGPVLLRAASADETGGALRAVQSALAGYEPERGRSVVHVAVHYSWDYKQTGGVTLAYALDGAAARAGYVPATRSVYLHARGYSLADHTARLRDGVGADAPEPGVGDDRVRAFRVRTPLSRVLTNGADGVVDIRTPLDAGPGGTVPAAVEKSADAALAALALPRGGTVDFLFEAADPTRGGEATAIRSAAQRWATAHGLVFGTLGRVSER
ncbi:RNA polymerase sigma factor [bacterium]|nr:RNA polymerase sigma factor [bacterium]